MKSHTMSLFLGVMACFCITTVSCKSDSIDDLNRPSEAEETSYFSISVIGAAGLSTRALQTEEGIANESKVNEILLALYNTSTGDVEYQFPLDIHSDGSSTVEGNDLYQTGSTVKQFQTIAKQVKRQNYNLLVVLNPRDAIVTATAEGQNISVFKTAVTLKNVTDLTGALYDNFLMCNWQDLVFADAGTSLFSTEEEALSNPVSVYVERAVSKVMVDGSAGKDKAFSIQGWAVDVVNKKTYWMRQPWMAISNNGTGVTNEAESPNVSERYFNYAKDPNAARDQYDGNAWHSYKAWFAHDGTGVAPDTPNKDFTFIRSASAVWKTPGTSNWIYVPENTMEAVQQYSDVATSIVLKAKYDPEESALGAAIAPDASYFVYYIEESRYIFTAEELEAEYTYQKNNEGKSQTYTDSQVQEFMNNIEQYRALLGEDIGFTVYASISDTSRGLQEDFGFFDSKHINYYRIPIPHFSEMEQPDPLGYGRYGVVRNNVYKLTIDDIYGPGMAEIVPSGSDSGEDPDDPDGPDDPDDPDVPGKDTNWLSFRVRILDWTIRTHGVSAGDE